jgi:amino acid adenylation domain-containing protein
LKIVEFLSELRSLDIQVFLEGESLRCNAPEGILTPELRGEITQHKSEIISFLKSTSFTNNYYAPIVPIPKNGNLPLSFAQQRLWFLDQLVPNNPFYNVPTALRLTGVLNLVALEKTFQEIVRRHEALRTTFATVEGKPVQKITTNFSFSLPLLDLRSSPKFEQEIAVKNIVTQEAQQPFNLATDLLIRVKLLQLAEAEYLLIINLHHIVSDGWSIGVLIKEISTLYTAFTNNKPSPLPELAIQYADFAHWQRELLKGKELETQLAFWRKQLTGISRLDLPSDRPRPATQSYKGGTQRLQLPKDLSARLEALSQQEGVTLFMTLLAAFKILLYRYTQQEDIVVGSPIANRNRSEIEGLIGFFVNSLVLRTNLSGNPTFREVLNRVKEVALEAYAYQDLPFEKLVEELEPERKINQNPLFDVAFALQNAPMKALKLPELTLHPEQFNTGTTRFDLEFHLWESSSGNDLWVDSSQGISGLVVYSTDLFDDATITRMLGHFQTLLENIVANPETRIANLQILSQLEQNQLLIEWNQTEIDYPQNNCIHELFTAQVERTPDAIALVFDNEKISYGELSDRTNQLAHYLQKLGVTAEVLVGICLERSPEMIVAMLAIMKAGGAYLPLDPNYPPERLSFMVNDAQIPILITDENLVERLGKTEIKVICLDKDGRIIAQEKATNPISKITINNLAYVIYTSGSTGKPKGVEIEHRGLLNLIFWHQKAFSVSPQDKVTQISGVAFDACGWEIWPYLTIGASIYFPDQETRINPEKLRDWLVENQITISFIPTVLTEKIILLEWPNHTALRFLLTGGDQLKKYPLPSNPFQLINNYGPTENTVVTTSGQIAAEEMTDLIPTIGRPIPNTKVYVLDRNLQPVPIGIPGELYISSNGLARGYLNSPELTNQKFIPHPFSNEPKAQLYKTGDLVRYRIDGTLEFLGRLDDQVKIRGYRIELGEIEAVISQHPLVTQTVVVSWKNSQNEHNLVAYLVLNTDSSQQIEQMQLPDEQISQWQMLYEETYNQTVTNLEPTFNIIGWNSSYTNQPIPAEEMRNWVNNQVAEILALQPKKVLEIGCGTGLLLFRIAPHCTEYWGTDFSAASLHYIQQEIAKQNLPQVQLFQKMATDFTEIAAEIDTVILNSVVQYFPSIDYLLEVLEGAIKSIAANGFIFIGDVRSLPLLPAFHASVQLEQAEASLSCEQLQQRVQMQIFEETELAIDPAFFTALTEHFPEINHVEIGLMRGSDRNELTQFRYNVILHIRNESLTEINSTTLNWSNDNLNLANVRQLLRENQPEIITITQVSNARVTPAVKTAECLHNNSEFKTVLQIRQALQNLPNSGIDPEDWYSLADELNYNINISWSDSSLEGKYDVIFINKTVKGKIKPPQINTKLRPWQSYANNPLQAKAARHLVPELRQFLAEKLPDYMIPSAFIVLESLPVTANGKIDRHTLPTPNLIKSELPGNYIAPRTPIEQKLMQIFTEVLGIKRVGIHDNFFELGGHSLLATQMVSRVRDRLQIELPVRSVFEAPTIAELAKLVETFPVNQFKNNAPALVPISRESRRTKLSSLYQDQQNFPKT